MNPITKFDILVDHAGVSSLTFVNEQHEAVTITGASDTDPGHPNFWRIVDALRNQEDLTPLLSLTAGVAAVLDDERVVIKDDVVYFNGEAIHNKLTETILRYQREGRDTTNLVAFMERLDANPSRHSRDQLFTWTESQHIVIDEEGFIIGYKGVNRKTQTGDDGESLTSLVSATAGEAIVDGVEVKGHIPNNPGSVIEMPRGKVQDDPSVACSHGLHVGSFHYAKNFAKVLLQVRVDPADVVSVPKDSGGQKLRCCRYEVIGLHEEEDDTIAATFEPEATNSDEKVVGKALDGLEADGVPNGFMAALRARFRKQ